jgi:hypothetical protein
LFGDVTTANGNPSLAVFAPYTPNQHAFLQRFIERPGWVW